MPELIVALQKSCFVREVPFDRPPSAGKKKFGVRGCIEVSVEIRGVIQHPDVELRRQFPFDQWQKALRIALQHTPVLVDLVQDRGRYGNTTPGD
ncbi:hypothetical protein SLT36_26605 [Aminobacter sp. BA135]|uniref:hypothetical protein n=1 Tax=Phyllobacteriaceae TaxID=69277 RepID=UPI001FE35C21|nr:hypothetical protein [Mesorhizobium intechi]